ncbi:hypothetical protein AB0L17_34550, partial [Streptomyces cellulosae]
MTASSLPSAFDAADTSPDGTRLKGTSSGRGRMGLLVHQIRYEQLSFWRNPQAMIFTFLLPVVVVVVFGAAFGGGGKQAFYFGMTGMEYYTPSIA